MKKLKTSILIAIICGSLAATGCPKKTTLDRVGAIVTATVDAYANEIHLLHARGLLTQQNYDRLEQRADAIKLKAQEFDRLIAGLSLISQGDAPAIFQQISGFVGLLDASITDPALAGLGESSRPVKALRYVRALLDAASIAIAAIFPPPAKSDVGAMRSFAIRPAVAPNKIVVNLPRMK